MGVDERSLTVLFADVAGSTRLYEQLGDEKALAAVGECLALVERTAAGHAGRLIKTIGDEAMVVFPAAEQAAAAAAEIQGRMTDFAQAGNYRIAFRIGFHCGAAIERDGDVFGDSVNVAARMVGLAKSGQVILSAPTAETLSAALRERSIVVSAELLGRHLFLQRLRAPCATERAAGADALGRRQRDPARLTRRRAGQ